MRGPSGRGHPPPLSRYISELGVTDKLALKNLDMGKEEHKSAEYKKIHPLGQLPSLTDGPFSLFESGALLLYIGETFGALDTPQKRAKAVQWIVFSQSTLSNALFMEQVGGLGGRGQAMRVARGSGSPPSSHPRPFPVVHCAVTTVAAGSRRFPPSPRPGPHVLQASRW